MRVRMKMKTTGSGRINTYQICLVAMAVVINIVGGQIALMLRLPIYLELPIRHKHICHEPMLGPINIEPYLATGKIEYVLCGGESGEQARPCHYQWILDTRDQCIKYHVPFHFKQTGTFFVMNGKTYHIKRWLQQSQAAKAGIDYDGGKE